MWVSAIMDELELPDYSTYVPSTEEMLLMFAGGVNSTDVSQQYADNVLDNISASSLMANVTFQHEKTRRRIENNRAARASKNHPRQVKTE
jgi:hypothetical protein